MQLGRFYVPDVVSRALEVLPKDVVGLSLSLELPKDALRETYIGLLSPKYMCLRSVTRSSIRDEVLRSGGIVKSDTPTRGSLSDYGMVVPLSPELCNPLPTI